MPKSFLNEIPKSRVNITLTVDEDGVNKKVELPLSFLVLGNFSALKRSKRIAEKNKIHVNASTINAVLRAYAPNLKLVVNNKIDKLDEKKEVNLTFRSMKDFHPDNIVNAIPQLKELLAMRNLLKELRSCVSNNYLIRKQLEMITQDKKRLEQLTHQLPTLSANDL